MASAGPQAAKLTNTLVELVVADGVDVEADEVHRLNGRLVVEQRRDERRCADEVTGGHHDGVPHAFLSCRDVRRKIVGSTNATE